VTLRQNYVLTAIVRGAQPRARVDIRAARFLVAAGYVVERAGIYLATDLGRRVEQEEGI